MEHISIREAADRTGLNRGSWQEWERGAQPRDVIEVARRIASTLDVDLHWLLFGGPLREDQGALSSVTKGYLTEDPSIGVDDLDSLARVASLLNGRLVVPKPRCVAA